MSQKSTKKPRKLLGEGKTLPALAPDARRGKGSAALQSRKNVARAKRWVDDHES